MTSSIFTAESPLIESMEDLELYFRSSETPSSNWRVGTEHEKIGFHKGTAQPLPYEGKGGVREILKRFSEKFGWEEVWEGDYVIALLKGQASLTLEPGGQLELSGAPVSTTHETCQELNQHLHETEEISREMDLTWLFTGANPLMTREEMPWMPKERYSIMKRYLPGKGERALDMMLRTATAQTNIDYASEEDMARKISAALGLSPLITALYASSPLMDGKPTGFLSTRSWIWEATDPDRCGFPVEMLKGEFGYREYVRYALDAPMFFIHREGKYLDYAGKRFLDFIEKGFDGHRATQQDWILHLTTVFPWARVKNCIELRMVDVGPMEMICSLPALTRGLFYDETALKDVLFLLERMNPPDMTQLQHDAARSGLKAETGGRTLLEWARDLLEITRGGLKRLDAQNSKGETEEKFLDPLFAIVETGQTQADEILALYNGSWKKDPSKILQSRFAT